MSCKAVTLALTLEIETVPEPFLPKTTFFKILQILQFRIFAKRRSQRLPMHTARRRMNLRQRNLFPTMLEHISQEVGGSLFHQPASACRFE